MIAYEVLITTNHLRDFIVCVLESRALELVSFKEKLQKQIEAIFLPPDEDDAIAVALLGQALGEGEDLIEVDDNNNGNNNNANASQKKGRRRKSVSDGVCEKTLNNRFNDLDKLVKSENGISLQMLIE